MAVAKYQTKNGPRWIADVYQDGIRIGRKAGFRSRREALAWEEEQKSLRQQPDDMVLRDVCTAHLLYCESRLKPNTISYKKTAYRRFIEFAGAMTPFRSIGKATIDGFVAVAAKMISKKTANKYKTELSSLWAWAGKEGYAADNPPRQIDAYAIKKAVKYVPPANDIKSLLDAAKPGFEHDFLICLLHTAARISEIRLLAWEDVDLERRVITLWTSKRRGGNMEARKIAMSDTLYQVLSRLRESDPREARHVFTDPSTGNAFTRTSNRIKYLMRDLCLRAGVRHFGAHSLRHFMATGFHDPYKAQKVLGHQNLKTTEIYLHDLGVDREAASVFEDITNRITNGENSAPNTAMQEGENTPERGPVINSTNEITNEITNRKNSTNEKRDYFLQ